MFKTNYLELINELTAIVHSKATRSEIMSAIKDYLPDSIKKQTQNAVAIFAAQGQVDSMQAVNKIENKLLWIKLNNLFYLIDTGSHINLRPRSKNQALLSITASICNNRSINLYDLEQKAIAINKSSFSFYSYGCEINYSILGMQFILEYITNIDFLNNELTLKGEEKIEFFG